MIVNIRNSLPPSVNSANNVNTSEIKLDRPTIIIIIIILSISTARITVKSRLLAALVDKPQAQIMCQKSDKMFIPINKPQVYFVDVVKCVNEVCSQR